MNPNELAIFAASFIRDVHSAENTALATVIHCVRQYKWHEFTDLAIFPNDDVAAMYQSALKLIRSDDVSMQKLSALLT